MQEPCFSTLGLAEHCLAALREEGYESPTPIQTLTIPSLLDRRDLLGCAQTGTGKTAAFALPVIQILAANPKRNDRGSVRSLIVAPTRELAAQISASFEAYGRGARLSTSCVYGGVGKGPQLKAMSRGVDVLIATPGRLLDLVSDGAIKLSKVEIVVFDEADRMLDMGFIRDVRAIVALLPKERQTLLFSATMPAEIEALARTMLRNPVRVAVSPEKPTVDLIKQGLMYVSKADKKRLLVDIISADSVQRAIVFTRTKHGANRLAESLQMAGIGAGAIHANKSQNNRTKTMDAFRSGELRVLVATDLAARGIDVDGISHVFNYDLPMEPETYIHRIGRTARAGASGIAWSFCDIDERRLVRDIEKLLGSALPVVDHIYSAGAMDRAMGENGYARDGINSRNRENTGRRTQREPHVAHNKERAHSNGKAHPQARPQTRPQTKSA